MATRGFFNSFDDVVILGGVRTPMVDYCGALGSERLGDVVPEVRSTGLAAAVGHAACTAFQMR